MPDKSNSPGRKTKKPARPAPAAARAKATPRQAKSAYYVISADAHVSVTRTEPRDAKGARRCATFDEARSAAIDAMIAAIERAEHQLAVLKRAKDCREIASAL